jgi:hypothetical protein
MLGSCLVPAAVNGDGGWQQYRVSNETEGHINEREHHVESSWLYSA